MQLGTVGPPPCNRLQGRHRLATQGHPRCLGILRRILMLASNNNSTDPYNNRRSYEAVNKIPRCAAGQPEAPRVSGRRRRKAAEEGPLSGVISC